MSGVTVTIRCERADGQFTIAQTTVPDDLLGGGTTRADAVIGRIGDGFAEAYARLMRLPS